MTETPTPPTASSHHLADSAWSVVRGFVKRGHALVLAVLVLWLSWLAFRYLLVSLIFPAPVPPQITNLPLRATGSMLKQDAPAFVGVTAVANPRAPLGHYHRVDEWFQPDGVNGCTQSGCHAPLPHGKNKADRAFLNMHATSLHCGVCHFDESVRPLPVMWYDLRKGQPRATPALLRAYALLAVEPVAPEAAAPLPGLLREAAAEAGGNPQLAQLAAHFAAVRAGSDEWKSLITLAQTAVPHHFRGEYGAKLAVADARGQPRLRFAGNEPAAREYLERGAKLPEAERKALLERVHPTRRATPLACTDCHRETGGLLDLSRAGYPPKRVQQLAESVVVRWIQGVREGGEFQMPALLGGPPASQPASNPTAP